MIKTKTVTINGVDFQHTYSDSGYLIERDGVQYADAVDPMGTERVYVETSIPLDIIGEIV